jgi:RimJ/RimL family protein N-acetyltransferase
MKLLDVYEAPIVATDVLWRLLAERTPEQSISHKRMPTREEHEAFVASRPYPVWCLIDHHGEVVGACYLTQQREVGVSIFNSHRGEGLGHHALQMLMAQHPGKFLANINPQNLRSIRLFQSLGFNLIQHTYALAE